MPYQGQRWPSTLLSITPASNCGRSCCGPQFAASDGDDPYGFTNQAIEESIGPDNNFTMRQFRELRDRTTRLGKLAQSTQNRFGLTPKLLHSRWAVLSDILQTFQKLPPRRRRELDPHDASSPSSASASFNTLARVNSHINESSSTIAHSTPLARATLSAAGRCSHLGHRPPSWRLSTDSSP